MGCTQSVPEQPEEFTELTPDDTALDHPPTDYDKFNEAKREIDYWYNKPPRSIGSLHKQQMMDRLLPLNIEKADKDTYIEKLDSILLADELDYLDKQRIEREAEQQAQQPQQLQTKACLGSGAVRFTSPPIKIENLGFMLPVGVMTGHHVTPTDHGYLTANTWTNPGAKREENIAKFADVLSPAPGIVSEVSSMPSVFATSTLGDYHIIIRHSCTFYTVFIHVNQISDKLKSVLETRVPVNVEAGEVIGRSPAFDFAVYNENVTLGFINPETYQGEPWKIHTDNLFANFIEPIRTQLIEKNLRKSEPRSGKLDYDIDGTIAGNWFVENSNGYQGKPEYQRLIGYWTTHLSFAYDHIDSGIMVISMGDYGGETRQFAVKGNVPGFAEVTRQAGIVKYELVNYDYFDGGKVWDQGHYAELIVKPRDAVEGTVLVEMLENRKIKFESFPGKTASQVNGFTSGAKIYVR